MHVNLTLCKISHMLYRYSIPREWQKIGGKIAGEDVNCSWDWCDIVLFKTFLSYCHIIAFSFSFLFNYNATLDFGTR